MKKKIAFAAVCAALIGWLLLTVWTFIYAYRTRGYFTLGGEAFMLLIPALVWFFVATWHDMTQEDEDE